VKIVTHFDLLPRLIRGKDRCDLVLCSLECFFPTFRDNLSHLQRSRIACSLKTGPLGCPETSAGN
jgi:hypothetical protein